MKIIGVFLNILKNIIINEKKFKIDFWNYTNVINNNINNSIIFFTNNICESFNRTLNKKYIRYSKTMLNFKNCLSDIIKIYEQNATYKEKNVSLTRSLEHYFKINNKFEIITYNNIKDILNLYKDYLKETNLPIDEQINENMEADYEKKPFDYSDKESESSENELNIQNDLSNNDNENGSGNNDNIIQSNDINEKFENKKISNYSKNIKSKSKSKNNKYKNNKHLHILKKIYIEDSSINKVNIFLIKLFIVI